MDIDEIECLFDFACISIPRCHLRIMALSNHEFALVISNGYICWQASGLLEYLEQAKQASTKRSAAMRVPGHYYRRDGYEHDHAIVNGHARKREHADIAGQRGHRAGYLHVQ